MARDGGEGITPNPIYISKLPPKTASKEITHAQAVLNLKIDKQTEIQGIGRGVGQPTEACVIATKTARTQGVPMAYIVHDVPAVIWVMPAKGGGTTGLDEECAFKVGAQVAVVGVDPQYGTLVIYRDRLKRSGAACQDGMMAFIPTDIDVSNWPREGAMSKTEDAKAAARGQAVNRLLGNAARDMPIPPR